MATEKTISASLLVTVLMAINILIAPSRSFHHCLKLGVVKSLLIVIAA
jgi:hypothetical protein